MTKSVILCADDFAQTEAVSRGIVKLLDARRLSAVSCMTGSPRWNEDAQMLVPHVEHADIGLHFNLTHSFGEPAWSLQELMRSSLLHTLDLVPIRQSLHMQLDRFESSMHRAPDFVDGHQHVHAFPQIRGVVNEVLGARYPGKMPYLRRVSPAIWNHDAPLKAMVLRMMAYNADKEAAAAGFRLPAAFAGLYSLSPAATFDKYMRLWLASASSGTLLMCHPGFEGDAADDPIVKARSIELAYLASDTFARDLAAADVSLQRFE